MKFLLSKKARDIETVIYLILFSTYLLFSRIVPVSYSFDSIDGLLSMGFAGIGCLLILQDLLTDRYLVKVRFSWVLFLFLGVLTISNILNIQYGWVDNLKTIIWLFIHFFVLYTMSLRLEKEKNKDLIIAVFKIFNVLFSISILFSFLQYLFRVGYITFIHGDLMKIQGFYYNRLYGIFSDPNATAMISIWFLCFNSYFIKKSNNMSHKLYYIFNFFINLTFIILSNSRTSYIVLLLIVIFYFIFFVFNNHDCKKIRKKFISIIVLLTMFFPMLNFSKGMLEQLEIKNNFYNIKQMIAINESWFLTPINNNGNNKDSNPIKEEGKNNLKREGLNQQESRIDIWKGYLTSLKSGKWLFGLSPRNAIPYIEEHYPDNYIAESGFIAHSDYLAIIAYTGLAGFAVFVLLAVLILQYVSKKIRVKKKLDDFYVMSLLIVFSILVYGLSYRDILFCNTFTGFVFWLFMSYILNVKDDGIYEEDSTPSV